MPVVGARAVLLVGAGNNGGDALYAGMFLRRRGLRVTALCLAPDRAHAGGMAALRRAGGRFVAAASPGATELLHQANVIVDGIVGIGARPPLRSQAADLVRAANAAEAIRVAVDLPSGFDPDTGVATGPAFNADVTVTMGCHPTGLILAAGAGRISLARIGMDPADARPAVPFDASILTDDVVADLMPRPGIRDNKFTVGVTGIAAGSQRYPGAALLSAGAAVAMRPGLVRYAGPQATAVVQRWPEIVATTALADAGRVEAWVVGPGMGTDGAALAVLRDVLASDVPVLVDADGLTLLAAHPTLLADRARRDRPTVLTPHAGEFARMFGSTNPDLDPDQAGRIAAVRAAAERSGAVILLKGHRTVVADPTGRAFINMTGTPQLATAGSGDVLSGMVGALLAAGLEPVVAAALGAHLHGRAGQASERSGRAGASGLLLELPKVLADMCGGDRAVDVVPSGT